MHYTTAPLRPPAAGPIIKQPATPLHRARSTLPVLRGRGGGPGGAIEGARAFGRLRSVDRTVRFDALAQCVYTAYCFSVILDPRPLRGSSTIVDYHS